MKFSLAIRCYFHKCIYYYFLFKAKRNIYYSFIRNGAISTKYQKELKWQYQAIGDKCKKNTRGKFKIYLAYI